MLGSYIKKTVLAFFIALFFYNYIITSVYFQYEICSVKAASERRLKEEPSARLERIAVHRNEIGKSLNFKEEDEFWLNGKLYDVKSRVEKADSIIFFCFNDSAEENILLAVKDTFFKYLNNLSTSASANKSNSAKLNWQLFAEEIIGFKPETKLFYTILERELVYNSVSLTPTTPPPRQLHAGIL